MCRILKSINVKYLHPYFVYSIEHMYPADFFIPEYNAIIEVDGKYWHKYPIGNKIDLIRNDELEKAGFKIFRFWENEFDEESVKKVLEVL